MHVIQIGDGVVVGALDRGFGEDEADRLMIHIGESLTLVMSPETAGEVADAMADVFAQIDDPAVVYRS